MSNLVLNCIILSKYRTVCIIIVYFLVKYIFVSFQLKLLKISCSVSITVSISHQFGYPFELLLRIGRALGWGSGHALWTQATVATCPSLRPLRLCSRTRTPTLIE